MAIQFIMGAGGTGKTRYIYEKMIQESMKKEHTPILFILPEQANMAAEQDMVMLHPAGGTMDISILSFTRLAFKVFDELNISTHDILDDYGKSMLIMKLLKEHENELVYYKNMIGKQGFVDEVKSILSEFYQYQITEDGIERVLTGLSPDKSLYYKLTDIKRLLHAFEEEIKGSYMVTEQILSLLKEVSGDSALLKNAQIYFDGFTGFTPVQYDVMEALMKLGGNLYFSITMDGNLFGDNGYSEQGLFALSKQVADRLCKLAARNQIPVSPHVELAGNYRFQGNKELLHLERQLFRFPGEAYEKEPENVLLYQGKDSRQEAMFIAKTIKEYVREEGYRYGDFAVITGDLQEQAPVWRRTMELLKIPYFLDYNEPLSHNPVVELVGMVMELFRTDFSYESVFSLLKTGFFDIDMNRIYDLENYVLKYGVRGYSWWSHSFRGGVKGLSSINETRQKFIDCIAELAEVFQKESAKVKDYLLTLYNFMSTNKMAEQLYEKSVFLEGQGRLREAKAYVQAYDKFISVMDKTMDILGEEELERSHFMDIFLVGISDVSLGVIPTTLDQVLIGDMERTRLQHVKVVFVAGANEGLLPKSVSGRGILTDKDRSQLRDMQMLLAPDGKEEFFLQQFYLYLQMVKAKEKLVISFRQCDERGVELRPSYFVNRIQHIFPKLQRRHVEEELRFVLPSTREEMVHSFATQLAEDCLEDASLYNVMKEENEEGVSRILEGYFYNNETCVLDKAIARSLYGDHMVHSVSRLETYSGCAYQFFLQYGLKLAKREEYKVESNHIGTILHGVMEQFFKKVKAGEIKLSSITKQQMDSMVEALTRQAAMEENDTIFQSSYRNRHQLDVLMRIAKRSVDNLCRHLKQGNMEPAYFEKRFSPQDELDYIHMALSQGVQMEMSGIIDRVDVKEMEHAVYVKVVDYKSGAKDIDYVKMYEGKQLQLTVYMSVMLELLKRKYPDKTIIPTGMYYYHIFDPIIEETNEEKQEQKRIEQSRLSGLVNSVEESLQLMDGKTGQVVPVRYKKDGDFDSRNRALVTTEELLQISEFVREKMKEIGEHIIAGEIPMNPEKGEISSPCNFCDYRSVCRFEAGLGGNAYRIGCTLDREEAKKQILNKGGENA